MDQTSETEKIYQKEKFEEIISILLSAGYFRARINTLSEFDKVVGGLCWCITSTGEDVDVDILFQENSTIGQRIALSEAIVKALRKMNCPSPLQPHQIQGGVGGSDFPAIYPVIVWLIKKYFERRVQKQSKLRDYSILQFSKNYTLPNEELPVKKSISKKAVKSYRRHDLKGASEETKVHACLLEYGESLAKQLVRTSGDSKSSDSASSSLAFFNLPIDDSSNITIGQSSTSDLTVFEKKLAQAAKEAQKEEKLLAEQASKAEAELLQQMSKVKEDGSIVSGSQVGAIVGLHSDAIGMATAAYQAELEEAKREMDNNLASGKLGQAAAYKRQHQSLSTQLDEIKKKSQDIKNSYNILTEKLRLLEEEKVEAIEYNGQLEFQIKKLNDLEANSSQQAELATLKRLVTLNESLKSQEAAFKASCKEQMQEFTNLLKVYKDADDENSEENQKFRDIEEMHEKVMAKYDKLRQMLAETNLEVANTSRIIDDVPTRTELIQYERRFVELYQQVAWKLEETRKYYDLYNTLETTLTYLQKEIKLLNSISENFTEAMKSSSSKIEFLKQFESIVKGVEDTLNKQKNNILVVKTNRVEELKVIHQNLVEEQRSYYKAVKDFQEECTKNEWLTSKLEQLKAK